MILSSIFILISNENNILNNQHSDRYKLIESLKKRDIKIFEKEEFECDFYNSIDKENIIKGYIINSDYSKREVAIKRVMLIPDHDQILSEIELLNELKNNPHFVNFYGVYIEETKNIILIFLELLCMNLRKFLDKKSIKKEEKLSICRELLECILVLHSKGIIHRDLKPENICFDQFMKLKLIDFGKIYIIKDHLLDQIL